MRENTYLPSGYLVDCLLDAVCVVDREGRFVFVSAACERIFGYTPDEMIGRTMIELVHPQDRLRTLEAASAIMAGRHNPSFENRYLHKDGHSVHILWSARWSEDQQVRIAVAHDISERKRHESLQAALYAISEAAHGCDDLGELFAQVHQSIASLLPARRFSILLAGADGVPTQAYSAGETAQEPAAPLSSDEARVCAVLLEQEHPLLLRSSAAEDWPPALRQGLDTRHDWLAAPLRSPRAGMGALLLQGPPGQAHYAERDLELLQFVSTQVATAIERQQMLARLQFMAQHDALTQLPNRTLLHDRLQRALTRAQRNSRGLALLFIDLDNFKQVNDNLGHASGDQLLQQVAQRLRQCLRASDTVARFGGDEFVILLEGSADGAQVSGIAEKIRQVLRLPVELAQSRLSVQASIGIALFPEHAADASGLLEQADQAMYQAKQAGGDRARLSPPRD